MIEVFRKLFSFLDERSKVQFRLLLLPMLLTALLEMASIGMVLPLLYALVGGEGVRFLGTSLPVALSGSQSTLLVVAAGFVGFFVLKNAAILGTLYLITRFTQTRMARFQQRLFDLYMRRPYAFHLQRNTAEITRNLYGSVSASFEGLRLGMVMILDSALALAALGLMVFVEPKVSLGMGVFLLVLGFGLHRTLAPLFHRWGDSANHIEARLIQSVNQAFGAIKDVKVLGCHSYLNRSFASLSDRQALLTTRAVVANQSPRLFIETLLVAAFLAVLIALMHRHDSVAEVVSVLGLFGMVGLRLMPSLNRILSGMAEIRFRTARVDTLYTDLHEGLREALNDEETQATPGLPFARDICFDDLSYSYPILGKPSLALDRIRLCIAKGESIGVVGPSGSGKTTLVNVFMGLLQPDAGCLRIDGVDVSGNLWGWQRHLGYVPQNIYLLDDTLRRNIAFGIEDGEIDAARVREVVRMAHLDEVVAALPEGLETRVGEQGVRLSGGQRQRVGIARALYRNPSVLVFDEATSALDNETEREVTRAIEELSGTKTVLIIAHRLSTVNKCDRIVFIDKGSVAGIGGFDELRAGNEAFARFVRTES